MPQAPRNNTRQESKDAQKAMDKEQKRSRGAMSCAECRRLKLKCDKTVPCSSCKRRGCSAICPNGSLITGQGTRFVLADTEKLHAKIALMSDRIRQLEDALAILQQSVIPDEEHSLLQRDLLDVKSIIDLHAAVDEEKATVKVEQEVDSGSQYIEAFGTLAIRDDGAATFYGPSAGSESLLIGESSDQPLHQPPRHNAGHQEYWGEELSHSVKHLSKSFPLAPVFNDDVDLNYLVEHHLPPWHRARQLVELYLSQAPWFFGAVTQRQLVEEVLPSWYMEATDLVPPGTVAPNSSDSGDESSGKGPHELALLFVVFCFGALTDHALPAAPDNEEADMYFKLTRAALNLEPVLDRPPSVATVQTLALLAIYQGLCSGENSIESTWGLFGLATKLAQSIGLHRDCARWNLSPGEVQKRRALFWELFITDGWQSLATGRLATFYLPYVDCELPADPNQTLDADGSVLPSFPAWKARFGFECTSAIIQHAQTAKVPKYSLIVELDRKVRDMELPKYAERSPPSGAPLAEAMKHFMPINYRHWTLLYVHRCFFAEAVSSNPTNPMNSPYAPSFLAGYRSACEVLGSLRTQFDLFPAQIARFWVLWTHAFSSSVMLASVVTHASGSGAKSKITSAALLELRRAVDLFKQASVHGGRAGKFLPILQRLLQKADLTYSSATPPVVRNDIFAPSQPDEKKDELSIFSGQTHRVSTKAIDTGSSNSNSPAMSTSADPASATTESPPSQNQTIANLHPTLLDQWNSFEGHLNTQLYQAQQDTYHDEEDTYMNPGDGPQRGMTLVQDVIPPAQYHSQSPTSMHQTESTYNADPRMGPAYSSSYAQRTEHQPREEYYHYERQPQYRVDETQHHQSYQFQRPGQMYSHPHAQYQSLPEHYDQYQSAQSRQHSRQSQEPQNRYPHTHYSRFSPHNANERRMDHSEHSYQDSRYRGLQYNQLPQAPPQGYTEQHHHLQETWASFQHYVGSPARPT
ncbi:fungal-specific transcription factor domain-containing protein [Hygrophoropsis aurantiaca]|uniref:Fungal-specific transcription factor domain-containing protein n=1 Tax=Hygrophoropsis aurantiaca TaxID=72124 RepID=A0ACB8AJG5_9AGAM|nr:fungal-specific transcription factor domain-containing protein [Hygrophoropsis aurantiaca]